VTVCVCVCVWSLAHELTHGGQSVMRPLNQPHFGHAFDTRMPPPRASPWCARRSAQFAWSTYMYTQVYVCVYVCVCVCARAREDEHSLHGPPVCIHKSLSLSLSLPFSLSLSLSLSLPLPPAPPPSPPPPPPLYLYMVYRAE
jgi:hypothetical protein